LNNTETNKPNFKADRQLEYKFHRIIKAILGNQFICQDEIEDLNNGTDFLLLKANPFRIGVRLRRYEYFKNPQYRTEFTIRWERPSGVETEIHKINQGLVDYILYGFVDEREKHIIQYFIGDLMVFKDVEATPVIKPNTPLDSWLAIYEINQFPDDFIIRWYNRP